MKKSVRDNLLLSAFIAFGICCIFLVYSMASKANIEQHIINSDTLYLPSIYLDVFSRGHSFFDWSINGAPNYFPDMFLFFLFNAISGNFLLSIVLFTCAQYALIVGLSYALLKPYLKEKTIAVIGLSKILLLLLPLSSLMQNDFEFAFQFLANSYHVGAFINTLLALWLVQLTIAKSSRLYPMLLTLVVTIAFCSDLLFVAFFIVPLLGASVLIHLINWKKPEKQTYKILGLLSIGVLFGQLINRAIVSFTTLRSAGAKTQIKLETIQDSWTVFSTQYTDYLTNFSVNTVFILLLIASFSLAIWKSIRSKSNIRFVYLFAVLFLILATIAPIIMGVYFGYDTIRYNYAIYLFAPFILAVALHSFGSKKLWLLHGGSILLIFIIVGINYNEKQKSAIGLMNYTPQKAVEIDALASENELTRGVATYWDAKLLTMFNSKDIFIVNCYDEFTPYEHVSNRTWWRIDPETNKQMLYDFVIIGNEKHEEFVRRILGEPTRILTTENLTVFTYPNFYYPENSYEPQLVSR